MNHASFRNVLVAVDGSENSRRAVEHVAEMLGGSRSFSFTLLHVIAEPDPDYFSNKPGKRLEWIEKRRSEAQVYLKDYAVSSMLQTSVHQCKPSQHISLATKSRCW